QRVRTNCLADRSQQAQPVGVLALGAPPVQHDPVHYPAAHERLRLTSYLCTKGIVMPIEQIMIALRPTQDALTAGVPLPPGTGVRKTPRGTVSVAKLCQQDHRRVPLQQGRAHLPTRLDGALDEAVRGQAVWAVPAQPHVFG